MTEDKLGFKNLFEKFEDETVLDEYIVEDALRRFMEIH